MKRSIISIICCFILATYADPEKQLGDSVAHLDLLLIVINLDSATDRLEAFRESYASSDLRTVFPEVVRFPAIEGSRVDLKNQVTAAGLEEIAESSKLGYRKKHYELTINAVGCYISHFAVWETLLSSQHDAALVFEDDAVIAQDAYARLQAIPLPADTDILLLGDWCMQCMPSSQPTLRRVEKFLGMFGYIITKKGAQRINKYAFAFPIRKQLDSMLSDMIEDGQLTVYQAIHGIVGMNSTFPTSVQTPWKKVDGVFEWE